MKKKETDKQTRIGLGTWLGRNQIKFSVMTLGLSILAGALYAAIAGAVTKTGAPTWPVSIIMLAVAAFCIYRLIKRLPSTDFDRSSLVALSGGAIVTTGALLWIYIRIASKIMLPMMMWMNQPTAQSNAVAFYLLVSLFIMAIISLYVLGVAMAVVYATYLRTRMMGVSKWRAILSLPFSMLWIPGFIMPENSKSTKKAIDVRPEWYKRLVGRICDSRVATWLACLIIITLFGIVYGGGAMLCLAIPFAIYALWHIVRGADNTRADIRGPFAIVSIIVNIIVIAYVAFNAITPTKPINTQPAVIEISDTTPTAAE